MYLGLDLSTQQLKGVIIDDCLKLQSETVVAFDTDLPQYMTSKGVYIEGRQVMSPVAMWVEALDLLLMRMRQNKLPLDKIRGISGSGQQHGSIYWSEDGDKLLGALSPNKSLVDQLNPKAFAHALSPNWQDASTQEECDQIEQSVGGPDRLAEITGSKAHHRFTGPQIMRVRKRQPEVYARTKSISLVSSFLCSLLLGRIAPIDPSDICGGNFWDIREERFDETLLNCISGGEAATLREKLGVVCMDGSTVLGSVAPYYQQKYGFSTGCRVVPFTGDNPATILALPLLERNAMISLGTSTTMLLSTPHYVPSPAYHLFAHPTTPGFHMAMLCYKNGSLAREYIRNAVNKTYGTSEAESWEEFNEVAIRTATPNRSQAQRKLGFYFPLPEIIPQTESGTWRFLVGPDNKPRPYIAQEEDDQIWKVPEDDCRAILDSQFLDIRMRSQPFFSPEVSDANNLLKQASRIYVVGGASKNPAVIKVAEEVLGSEDGIYRQLEGSSNACALGGANKAAWAILKRTGQSFEDFVGEHWNEEEAIEKLGEGYQKGVWEEYGSLLGAVEEAENLIIRGI